MFGRALPATFLWSVAALTFSLSPALSHILSLRYPCSHLLIKTPYPYHPYPYPYHLISSPFLQFVSTHLGQNRVRPPQHIIPPSYWTPVRQDLLSGSHFTLQRKIRKTGKCLEWGGLSRDTDDMLGIQKRGLEKACSALPARSGVPCHSGAPTQCSSVQL